MRFFEDLFLSSSFYLWVEKYPKYGLYTSLPGQAHYPQPIVRIGDGFVRRHDILTQLCVFCWTSFQKEFVKLPQCLKQ